MLGPSIWLGAGAPRAEHSSMPGSKLPKHLIHSCTIPLNRTRACTFYFTVPNLVFSKSRIFSSRVLSNEKFSPLLTIDILLIVTLYPNTLGLYERIFQHAYGRAPTRQSMLKQPCAPQYHLQTPGGKSSGCNFSIHRLAACMTTPKVFRVVIVDHSEVSRTSHQTKSVHPLALAAVRNLGICQFHY